MGQASTSSYTSAGALAMTRSAISSLRVASRASWPGVRRSTRTSSISSSGTLPARATSVTARPPGEHEDEALERAAALRARERRVEGVAALRDRAGRELEAIARAGAAERRAHHDLAPPGRRAAAEQLQAGH